MYNKFKENYSNIKFEDILNVKEQLKPEKNKMDKIIVDALNETEGKKNLEALLNKIEEILETAAQNTNQDPEEVVAKFEEAIMSRISSLTRMNIETTMENVNKGKTGFEGHPDGPLEGPKEKAGKFKGLFK